MQKYLVHSILKTDYIIITDYVGDVTCLWPTQIRTNELEFLTRVKYYNCEYMYMANSIVIE